MDTNKKFEVILSSKKIEMLEFEFEFEVVGDGTVEISSTKTGQATVKYSATESSPQTVSIVKDDFNLYTITAEAKPIAGNKLSAWSGTASGSINPLTITSGMAGNITANFIVLPTWNGTAKEEPLKKNAEGHIYVSKAEHIKWISDTVNAGNSLTGKTYILENDIYFDNKTHVPIGYQNYNFAGTFDGNNFAIKNANFTMKGGLCGFFWKKHWKHN